MTRDFRRRSTSWILILVLASCSKSEPSPVPGSPLRVCILHTSDLHGRVDRLPSLAAFVRAERARLQAEGVHVLHIDSGDIFQGTPEGDLTRGRVVAAAFNEMGVDAVVPGNHDFDLGPAVTEELARVARFPFLAANLRLAGGRGPPAWLRASLVRRDARVEILGLAPEAMDRISTRRAREGLTFGRAAEAVLNHEWTPGMARISATHLGIERDRLLPLNGIAAVLGGHTHIDAVERKGNTLLIHPGSHGLSIGRIELEIDPASGAVRGSKGEVLAVPAGRDAAIERIIEASAGDVRRSMAEVVGRLERDLPRGGPDFDGISSPLGNHLADLARDAADAEIAVLLRSSIRGSLFAGSIRRRDLYEATPFQDAIVAVRVTGAKLRGALERAVADDERLLVEVAGITMTYDREAPRGRRIRALDLDPRRKYRVATLAFMTEPRGMFAGAGLIRDTGRTLLDLHAEFTRANSPFAPPPFRPRIVMDD